MAVEVHHIYQMCAVVKMYRFVQVYLNFHSIMPLPMVVENRLYSNVISTIVPGTVTSMVLRPTLHQVRHLHSGIYT